MEINLGGRMLSNPNAEHETFSALIWGLAGCGKTTLAATAPGKKLWVQFDRQALTSILHSPEKENIFPLDLSGEDHYIVAKFEQDDPFQLTKTLREHPEIETVVFDSVTTYSALAQENGVYTLASKAKGNYKPTIAEPGLQGYGYKNALTIRAVAVLGRICSRLGRNFIVLAHEAAPEKDKEGQILFITLALGGAMPGTMGINFGEVWWMDQIAEGKSAGQRRIAVRPVRMRKPMKTRMFDAGATGEFIWNFDPQKWTGDTIAKWFTDWKANGGVKLPLPK